MRLTACLIVRNEERHLQGCLSCITPIASEIVVVDTGSTDRTREIAIANGARLIESAWENNFAVARNTALKQASGDWILYLDADERFFAAAEDMLELEDESVVAATVMFRAASNLTAYREHRLFRNRVDLRFHGIIHETILPDLSRILHSGSARVANTTARIEHLGYEGDLHHKHIRNHSLLVAAVDQDPERVYLWHALGECELGLGRRWEAEKAWRTGLAFARRRPPREGDVLLFSDLFALHYADPGRTLHDVDALFEEALQHHASDPLIRWWLARRLMAHRAHEEAKKVLRTLIDSSDKDLAQSSLAYDRRLFGAWSQALLGQCEMAGQNWTAALYWFDQACADDPGNQELVVKRQLAKSKAAHEAKSQGPSEISA